MNNISLRLFVSRPPVCFCAWSSVDGSILGRQCLQARRSMSKYTCPEWRTLLIFYGEKQEDRFFYQRGRPFDRAWKTAGSPMLSSRAGGRECVCSFGYTLLLSVHISAIISAPLLRMPSGFSWSPNELDRCTIFGADAPHSPGTQRASNRSCSAPSLAPHLRK